MQKSVQVRTPLYAAAYWQQAADEFKNIRVLAFAGMVTALAIILESFPIYLLGQSLKIYFSFVVVSLGCACYGPLVGMGVGAVIDTLGFLLSSYGEPYFPGYLITAMLSGLIYGVMLYQRTLCIASVSPCCGWWWCGSSSTTAAMCCWAVCGKLCCMARVTCIT